MVAALSRRRSGFETHALLQYTRATHVWHQFTWGMGLLGDGHRVLSAEKRVRNPYALPIQRLRLGAVAQQVERAPHKGVVTGSIPVGATKLERSAE